MPEGMGMGLELNAIGQRLRNHGLPTARGSIGGCAVDLSEIGVRLR